MNIGLKNSLPGAWGKGTMQKYFRARSSPQAWEFQYKSQLWKIIGHIYTWAPKLPEKGNIRHLENSELQTKEHRKLLVQLNHN